MSVVSVTPSWKGKDQQRRNGETTRSDGYTVVADPPETGDVRNEIEAHASIPQYGQHPEDRDDIFVNSVVCKESGGPRVWEVIVTYSSRPNPDALDPETPPDQPELEPPSIEFGSEDRQVVFTVDADGVPVVNSADEPYDPALERVERAVRLAFTRNYTECTVTIDWLRQYTDVVNNDAIAGFGDRGEVLISGPPQPVYIRPNGETPGYFRVTFNLVIKTNPPGASSSESEESTPFAAHFRRVLDAGYRTKGAVVDDVQKYDAILTEQGSPVAQPTLLDGEGQRLPTGGTPTFLAFREYPEADLSPLVIEWPYCTDSSESASESGP